MPFGYPKPPRPVSLLVSRMLSHPGSCRLFRIPDGEMSAVGLRQGQLTVVCEATPRSSNSLVLASMPDGLAVRRLVVRHCASLLVTQSEDHEEEILHVDRPDVTIHAAVVLTLTDEAGRQSGLRWWYGLCEY